MCSSQLSWRQAPAAVKRSERQAREHQAKKQAVAEATNKVQKHKERQGPAQSPAAQVTEAEVSAVLQDPRYRQAGLTKGASQQIAQMKRNKGKAQQEQRQGKERYQTALLNKGRQEMEGWGHNMADKDEGSDKLKLLGTAWEIVLDPTAAGRQLSAKEAAGRVRCLAEQTARAVGTTMVAAVGAVLNVNVNVLGLLLDATPAILGVDFWAAHAAKFDFAKRVIDRELEVNGKVVKVPFTLGDEDVDEKVQAA